MIALGTSVTATESVLAQPSDAVTDVARQRYKAGVAAYDAGKYEEARQAFSEAYQLKKLPVMLLNLGQSELKSGHVAEGGNHLLQFLREYKEIKADEMASANAGIAEAKQKVGQVAISVNQSGADMSIDSVDVGKSPISEPLFAEPGTRTITASLNGQTASTKVEVKKGETAAATVTLAGGTAPTPPPPGPSLPQNPEPPPQPTAPLQPGQFSPNPGQQLGPPPDSGQTHTNDFGHWYAHHPGAWVGTGFAVIGLGVGIGFSAAAGSAASQTNLLANTIRGELNVDHGGPPCSQDGKTDRYGYGKQCAALRDSMDTHDHDVIGAAVGWVTFGVAAGVTVTYIMVDWFPKRNETATVQITPVVGLGYAGLNGKF